MVDGSSWLVRYHRGERKQVWHELRQLGSRVREEEFVEDAQAVCDAMARRAAHNLEVILARLSSDGFRFHSNDEEQRPVDPFVPATRASAEYAAWLEDTFGPIPLTVGAWVRLVGDVWLVGSHPRASGAAAAADPLVIEIEGSRYPRAGTRAYLTEEREAWLESTGEDRGPFVLPVAPDRLTKDNVSGGLPYGLIVPDGCADALFVGETTTSFVSYLNSVFANGGFPYTAGSDHGGGRSARRWPKACCRSDGRIQGADRISGESGTAQRCPRLPIAPWSGAE